MSLRSSLLLLGMWSCMHAQVSGFLSQDGKPAFPIGTYEFPKTDADLKALSEAGFNLVRCRNKADLDRLPNGMLGWVSLPMQPGREAALRETVETLRHHPSLAVWEGPDEMIWGFTAFSGLYRSGVHKQPGEWWLQTPDVLEYAAREGGRVLNAFHEAARVVRSLDDRRRPLWMNEAAGTDVKYLRDTMDAVDITGCDIYPIRAPEGPEPAEVGDFTTRYSRIGKGRPVWMVLQGFSWHLLPDSKRQPAYPNFDETRMMAWDAITQGAKGVIYWGTEFVHAEGAPFRESLLAMGAELSALQPFLTAPDHTGVKIELIEREGRSQPGERGVGITVRRAGDEWLIALVNRDKRPHMGVDITGLQALNGRTLHLLYGSESDRVKDGSLVSRLLPLQVKLFATGRKWETARRRGRDFQR